MEDIKIWNRIVKHYRDNYDAQEKLIQQEWEKIFSDLFNYSTFFGEIEAKPQLHIGSKERVTPDIIIKRNGKPIFDVELKQYNIPFSQTFELQLKSYMDLFHVTVGVIICKSIHIYVYDFANAKFKKEEVEFSEDSNDGINFVRLFRKENFSAEAVENFIDSKNAFKENVAAIKNELSDDYIRALVKDSLGRIYQKAEIDAALSDVSFVLTRRADVPVTATHLASVSMPKQNRSLAPRNAGGVFIIKSVTGRNRGKIGFETYDNRGRNVGITYKNEDKRRSCFGQAEICFYKEFFEEFGEWKLIFINKNRLAFDELTSFLTKHGAFEAATDPRNGA